MGWFEILNTAFISAVLVIFVQNIVKIIVDCITARMIFKHLNKMVSDDYLEQIRVLVFNSKTNNEDENRDLYLKYKYEMNAGATALLKLNTFCSRFSNFEGLYFRYCILEKVNSFEKMVIEIENLLDMEFDKLTKDRKVLWSFPNSDKPLQTDMSSGYMGVFNNELFEKRVVKIKRCVKEYGWGDLNEN